MARGCLCIGFCVAGLVAMACGGSDRDGATPSDASSGIFTATDSDTGIGEVGGVTTINLDVAMQTSGQLPCGEGEDCPSDCVEVAHTPCDQGSTDLGNAMGLNCPGEPQLTVASAGHPAGLQLIDGFGNTAQWDPTEGTQMVAIGSGYVSELFMETPPADNDGCPTLCNDDFDQNVASCSDPAKNEINQYDPGAALPAPLMTNDVGGDCSANPGLLGTGDCSNTIQSQFSQGMVAHDYTEVRITGNVPPDSTSLSYDFAFFSTEYPFYYGSQFNDMYVAWLQSESWTGNISFDDMGNPISLNAGFLDFRDDGGGLPEFAGTCMRQHAGTKWLTTTSPVTPGEQITLVLAVFDLSDSILDSYAFIDNFQWGCEGEDKPNTIPEG